MALPLTKMWTTLPGYFLFAMILLSILASVSASVSPLYAAACAWMALLLLLRRAPWGMLLQITLMMATGIACMVFSIDSLEQVPLTRLLSANHQLLALIAAVSFLRLITQPGSGGKEVLPRGPAAALKTLWGLHFLSAVITLSAMIIFGSRIEKEAIINRLHGIIFSRSFACGCFWSPFYVALATALLYAPGSELPVLALAGVPIALFGLSLTSWQLLRDPDIDALATYPIHAEALTVPLALSLMMIISHLLLPDFPVLTLITVLSLLLTLLMSSLRSPVGAATRFVAHIISELPRMNRELGLFLAAGVMSTGISVLINHNTLSLTLPGFTPLVGAVFIVAAILVSIIGVHPIVSISVVGSLLSTTDFDPNLLGVCMMMMWGLGIVVSPLSGVNLAIQGRFGLSSFAIMRWNAGYTLSLSLFCVALLYLYESAELL